MEKSYHHSVSSFIWFALSTELLLSGGLVLLYLGMMGEITGFRLENKLLLPLLALGPLFTLLSYLAIRWKNKALTRFGEQKLMPFYAQPLSSTKTNLRYTLYRFTLTCLSLAIINPQFGSKVADGKSQGIDIALCLDVSKSMLAEDLKPNRLVRAKRAIEQLLDRLNGDRISLIVFAGEAYTQLPSTTDYGAAMLFLNNVGPELVPTQGTALSTAIDKAMDGFDFEKKTGKAVILFTDGETHEGDAVTSAQYASDNGVRIFAVGMGSVAGGPIPEKNDFKKDKNGQVVISTLNEQALTEIAQAGNGLFVRASNEDSGIDILMKEINTIAKSEVDAVVYTDYEDRFQIFAGIALICLLVEAFLSDRKNAWMDKIDWFKSEK
ncbi:MAG TPA: VWA domain-containing protein [Luteibaculaceae bacterium]|nr:VWA domain-containing protein [Luteibaculaceae bacterium]